MPSTWIFAGLPPFVQTLLTKGVQDLLTLNLAGNGESAKTPSIPEAPEGKLSVPDDKYWKNLGIDPHEVKGYDSTRNLGVDSKGNVWSVDRYGSGNPQWEGTIDTLRQN